ncbi:MAG: hypothetical protein ACOX2L_00660 [Anaerolineae bacterium]|jgi:hypothetical protein|nr:hypothetical protein [Chloroflexota bacterium]
MVKETIAELIERYRTHVWSIDEDYYEPEAWLALGARDRLELRRQELTAHDLDELEAIDNELIARRELVREVYPSGIPQPLSHWWWYLDEGPQVRE